MVVEIIVGLFVDVDLFVDLGQWWDFSCGVEAQRVNGSWPKIARVLERM